MNKIVSGLTCAAMVSMTVDCGILGLKLLNGNKNILTDSCVALACLAVIAACAVYKVFHSRCPRCGIPMPAGGKYCSRCGQKCGGEG